MGKIVKNHTYVRTYTIWFCLLKHYDTLKQWSYMHGVNDIWGTNSLCVYACEHIYVNLNWEKEDKNEKCHNSNIRSSFLRMTAPILFELVAIKSLYSYYTIKMPLNFCVITTLLNILTESLLDVKFWISYLGPFPQLTLTEV